MSTYTLLHEQLQFFISAKQCIDIDASEVWIIHTYIRAVDCRAN